MSFLNAGMVGTDSRVIARNVIGIIKNDGERITLIILSNGVRITLLILIGGIRITLIISSNIVSDGVRKTLIVLSIIAIVKDCPTPPPIISYVLP